MELEPELAEVFLEEAHLMADRGLGDAELVGGIGKAHMAGSGLEGTQSIERRQGSLHPDSFT